MNYGKSNYTIDVLNWYKGNGMEASKLQILLAVEYVASYNYPVDIACNMALESYVAIWDKSSSLSPNAHPPEFDKRKHHWADYPV